MRYNIKIVNTHLDCNFTFTALAINNQKTYIEFIRYRYWGNSWAILGTCIFKWTH